MVNNSVEFCVLTCTYLFGLWLLKSIKKSMSVENVCSSKCSAVKKQCSTHSKYNQPIENFALSLTTINDT